MKKHILTLLFSSLVVIGLSQKVNHTYFDKLLKKYVNNKGWVDYQGIKKDPLFSQYLNELVNHPPQKNWTKNERLAYWINAYNAFTIQLIIKNYPVKSIKDLGGTFSSPWDIEFIHIGGKTYNLNFIEHKILRKQFNEPRIHFAIVCASISCPKLRNEAYFPEKLEKQLDSQAKQFINDATKNSITPNVLKLSQIFNWFKDDFTKNGTLIDFLNRYSNVKINSNAKISYLKYNWNLNEWKR